MAIQLSDRPAYVVFDHVEAMISAATGKVIRPAFWKASALVNDRDTAMAWANDRLHSRILETTYTHGLQIKRAEQAYTDADLDNFFFHDLLAAE